MHGVCISPMFECVMALRGAVLLSTLNPRFADPDAVHAAHNGRPPITSECSAIVHALHVQASMCNPSGVLCSRMLHGFTGRQG